VKNLKLLIALMLLSCSSIFAQFFCITQNFDSTFIKPSDLIIEGTIIQKTYFKDTSVAVKKYKFKQFTADSDGVWFVQYQVLVHKIFKGQCNTSKVTFIEPNYSRQININGNIVRPQFGVGAIASGKQNYNYYLSNTGIFCLKSKYLVKLTSASKNAYYSVDDHQSFDGYHKIKETHLYIKDGNNKIEFDSIEQFYSYIESYTKHKRKDITHIQFELLNSFDKVGKYRYKYFSDSSGNYSFNSKLYSGEINQLNKDSFIFNKSRFNNKPYKADSNAARYDSSNRSIKRYHNTIKKTGALYKSGTTITYTFNKETAKYIKTNDDVFFVFDIQFTADVSKYLYEANVALGYSTQVFGSNIANAPQSLASR